MYWPPESKGRMIPCAFRSFRQAFSTAAIAGSAVMDVPQAYPMILRLHKSITAGRYVQPSFSAWMQVISVHHFWFMVSASKSRFRIFALSPETAPKFPWRRCFFTATLAPVLPYASGRALCCTHFDFPADLAHTFDTIKVLNKRNFIQHDWIHAGTAVIGGILICRAVIESEEAVAAVCFLGKGRINRSF